MPRSAAISPEQFATFGALLKYLRQRAGLTQRELAIATGYTESHISRLEHDQRAPDAAVLAARFVPALSLDHERDWAARLLALASPTASTPAATEALTPQPASLATDSIPTNLPAELTSFVGRERELAAIQRLLADPASRLLTLGGAGGAGKTRLALRTGASLLPGFPGGVWFVDFSSVADPQHVAPTLVAALGLLDDPNRSPLAVAASFLKPRTALVILDNCEHLVGACAGLAQALLQACPHLRLLATSREVLGVPGEQFFRVPSLPTPDPASQPTAEALAGYEAVRLFIERARAALPGFALTPESAQAVAEICWQLDGIPLALELAAARVATLSVQQIAARLAEQGRFRLLTGGSRTAPTRQQTLQAMIEWSCHLLSPAERALFRRLAVFAGGWTLEAAEAVAGEVAKDEGRSFVLHPSAFILHPSEVLDLLQQLANKSLLIADPQPYGETRFRMLETIRHYAGEMLTATGEAEAVRTRHLAYALALAEQAEPHLRGTEQARWLDRLEADYGNLRAALAWAQDHDPVAGLRLAAALCWFWHLRGHQAAGLRALEALLDHAALSVPVPVRAQALTMAGFLMSMLSLEERAAAALRASLALWRGLGQAGQRGSAYALAYLMDLTPDLDEALAYGQESLAVFEASGEIVGLGETYTRLANNARQRGDEGRADALESAHLALATRAGDLDGQATAHVGLGKTAYVRGAHDQALAHFQRAYDLYRQVGNQWGLSYVLIGIGRAALARGDLEQAGQRIEAARGLHEDLGHCVAIGISSFHLGRVATLQSDDERAAGRYAEALSHFREAGAHEQMLAALFGLARAAHNRGSLAAARDHYVEALLIARQIGHPTGAANALRGLAAAAPDEARAVRLYAAAARLEGHEPFTIPPAPPALSTRDLFTIGLDQVVSPDEHAGELSRRRASLGDDAFAEAWVAGEALTLEEAVEAALALS